MNDLLNLSSILLTISIKSIKLLKMVFCHFNLCFIFII